MHEKLENLFFLLIIFNWNNVMTLSFIFLQVCTTLRWNQVKSEMEAYYSKLILVVCITQFTETW